MSALLLTPTIAYLGALVPVTRRARLLRKPSFERPKTVLSRERHYLVQLWQATWGYVCKVHSSTSKNFYYNFATARQTIMYHKYIVHSRAWIVYFPFLASRRCMKTVSLKLTTYKKWFLTANCNRTIFFVLSTRTVRTHYVCKLGNFASRILLSVCRGRLLPQRYYVGPCSYSSITQKLVRRFGNASGSTTYSWHDYLIVDRRRHTHLLHARFPKVQKLQGHRLASMYDLPRSGLSRNRSLCPEIRFIVRTY